MTEIIPPVELAIEAAIEAATHRLRPHGAGQYGDLAMDASRAAIIAVSAAAPFLLEAGRNSTDDDVYDGITWPDVIGAICARFWRLAPAEYAEARHRDLVFGVTWQDLKAAVHDGIQDVFAAEVDHLYDTDENTALCGYDLTDVPEGRQFAEMCPTCIQLNGPVRP